MNLTSFLANKCFEYLLNSETGKARDSRIASFSCGSTSTASQLSLLPPWALEQRVFRLNCDSCGNCIASCKNNILIQGDDGYPQVDFSKGSCTFCGACAESCPNGAFSYEPATSPWNLQAFITRDCLSHNNVLCRNCAEHCEEEAIIIPKNNGTISAPRILAERCTGCGACYSPCPAKAINIGECVGQEILSTREETG